MIVSRLTHKVEDAYYVKEARHLYEDTWELIQKLGKYENLEEELGIDLITLFKAIKTKIYAEAYHYKTGKPSILDFEEPRLIKHEEWCLVGTCGTFTYCVALKDFNKTWWLEKPKENDDD